MMTRALTWAVLVLSLVLGSCKSDKAPSAAAGPTRIAVIPKGTTHEFWKTVHAGAVKAADELDVEIVWKGPLKEDDLKAQIDVVQYLRGAGRIGHRARSAQRQGDWSAR